MYKLKGDGVVGKGNFIGDLFSYDLCYIINFGDDFGVSDEV